MRLQIAEQISHWDYWEPGQDCMEGGLTVRSRSREQPAVQSWTCGLERCRATARLLASWLEVQTEDFYFSGINSLPEKCRKCILLSGDYIEK